MPRSACLSKSLSGASEDDRAGCEGTLATVYLTPSLFIVLCAKHRETLEVELAE